MKKIIKIVKQYNFFERILLIFFGIYNKTIDKWKKDLFDFKYLLDSIGDDRYESKRCGKKNILKVNHDDIGMFQISLRRISSDPDVYRQIFLNNEFESLIDWIDQDRAREDIRFIIDAGANIGCSMINFKKNFPQAKIICIEPETTNFQCLMENIKINDFQDIVPLQRGLWIDDSFLKIKNDYGDKAQYAFQVEACPQGQESQLQGITIREILKTHNIPAIDILKMDIEGTERYLFESEESVNDFLPLVRYLAIEIHDEYKIRREIYKILKDFNFTFFICGERTIAFNERFKKANW